MNRKEDRMFTSRVNRTEPTKLTETISSVIATRVKRRGAHRAPKSRFAKAVSVVVGMALVGGGSYAATNWSVGLVSGSSAQGQSATVSNLTISAVASPSAVNLLFPGGNGDAVATITNPNPYPVTVTGVDLPTNTCLLYTSDAADEEDSVDLGGRR